MMMLANEEGEGSIRRKTNKVNGYFRELLI